MTRLIRLARYHLCQLAGAYHCQWSMVAMVGLPSGRSVCSVVPPLIYIADFSWTCIQYLFIINRPGVAGAVL